MKSILSRALLAATFICPLAVIGAASDSEQFWPQWRGPLATGAAPLADPPLIWSETNHVKWKAKIPGLGASTPIIWGDKVFILTAISTGRKPGETAAPAGRPTGSAAATGLATKAPDDIHEFVVLCYDRATGKILWQKTALEAVPHQGHHADHGYASASPVTDGQYLIAYFGSYGLHCYDLDGNHKWSKDLGRLQMVMDFGEGASAALHGDTVIVYHDDQAANGFVVALNRRTGDELWRKPRNDGCGWSTPLVIERDGKSQVVINATKKVISYDLATGQELWSCGGQTRNAIPTPVASADTVYVTSGFMGNALYAIALGRTGDLTGTDAIRWTHNKNTPYSPSPLLVDGLLYNLAVNSGVLSCFDARTGAVQFEGDRLEGLSGTVYSSPVAARNRVYVQGRDGACVVLKQGPKLEILAQNKLNDKTCASLALVGNELYYRGEQYLYCISEK
jgi:outer membrane protein assembly factor BamB